MQANESYPKLEEGRGFELLRTTPNTRLTLQKMQFPKEGSTSAHLADESNLGQALCYVRPIQQDLDMAPPGDNSEVTAI
jgi:hypothetical protein